MEEVAGHAGAADHVIPQKLASDMIDAGFSSEAVTRITGVLLNVCTHGGSPKRWQVFPESGYISAEWRRGGRSLMVTVGKAPDSCPVAQAMEVPAFPCGRVDPLESLARMGEWVASGDSDEEYDRKFESGRSHVNAKP